MKYSSDMMQEQALLNTAAKMCAAARTAPKAKGADHLVTLVLTGEDKEALCLKMEQIGPRENMLFYLRDAKNVRDAGAVVLIGIKAAVRRLPYCSQCGFESCDAMALAGGKCIFDGIDLGIAIGSACSVAADERVDSRVMYTAGMAAAEMGLLGEKVIAQAIPISISGKSIFFDRK